MVNLGQIIGGEGMDILDNFAGLPGGGRIMPADRWPVSLAANKAIGGAEVDEDGGVGAQGGGGLPVEGEAGGVKREASQGEASL